MLKIWTSSLILLTVAAAVCGCEATAEDIERWKGTQRGPAKITAVVVDSRYDVELRARAAVALVEIVRWDNFNLAFQRLSEEERRGVIHAMVPRLQAMYATGANQPEGTIPTDAQVNAKDAMADIYQMAASEDQALLREPLLDWITSDFNGHYLQGRRNIAMIIESIGAPAATALAGVINTKNIVVVGRMSKLIAEQGDEESKRVASENLAKVGRELGDRVRTDMWTAMATICGEPVRRFTLEYTARHQGDAESQANGITCVLEGGLAECGDGCFEDADLDPLFGIAEDEEQDLRIRAAAYDALRTHAKATHLERFLKMLDDPDARFRATGLEIAVHVGGAKVVPRVLEQLSQSHEEWPWLLKNSRTNNQEYGLCNMGLGQLEQAEGVREVLTKGLESSNAFVRGGCANMLGVVGEAGDVAALEKLASDRGRLKGWQPDTVAAQAKLAVERIQDAKRLGDASARRGQACGLNVR